MLLSSSGDSSEDPNLVLERIVAMMSQKRTLTDEERTVLNSPVPKPLASADIAGVAKYIAEGHAKNIIVMSFVLEHIFLVLFLVDAWLCLRFMLLVIIEQWGWNQCECGYSRLQDARNRPVLQPAEVRTR